MAMPLRRFWMMHKNIDRLAAEQDMRSLQVAAAGQSDNKHMQMYVDGLKKQIGVIAVYDEEVRKAHASFNEKFDRRGFNELKSMGKVR